MKSHFPRGLSLESDTWTPVPVPEKGRARPAGAAVGRGRFGPAVRAIWGPGDGGNEPFNSMLRNLELICWFVGKLLKFCSRKVISSKWHPRKTRQEGKRGGGAAPGYCDGTCRQWFPHGRAWASPSGWGMFLTYLYICVNLQVKHCRCTVRDSQWPSAGGDQDLKAQVRLVGGTWTGKDACRTHLRRSEPLA